MDDLEGLGRVELRDPDIGRRLEENQFIKKHLRHESNDIELTQACNSYDQARAVRVEALLSSMDGTCPMALGQAEG